jgi:hypothetical protein
VRAAAAQPRYRNEAEGAVGERVAARSQRPTSRCGGRGGSFHAEGGALAHRRERLWTAFRWRGSGMDACALG